jgi:hypothetical protein
MQPRRQEPEPDLSHLPESVARAIAAVQRQVIEAAQGEARAQPDAAEPSRTALAAPGRLDERLVLEAEAVRRRQLEEAFLRGQPGSYAAAPRPGRSLWAGLAIAVAVALALGLVAQIQDTLQQQGTPRPQPSSAALVSPRL